MVSNPLISLLGPSSTSHSRLTFAQAFNSLGTTVFPIAGSILILGSLASLSADQLSGAELDAYRVAESQAIVNGYVAIAIALALVAAVVWVFRNKLQGERHEPSSGLGGADLLKRPRFGFGALCIFLYVGAEVSIGSLIVSYLMQPGVMGLQEQAAGKLIGLYWGGAMVGRFIGSAVLRVLSPGKVLACVAAGAIALIAVSTNTSGMLSGYSLLAIGLMNAIMFPTIFSLACEKLGSRAADRIRHHQCRHFRWSGDPASHGRHCRRKRQPFLCAHIACSLLCHHRRFWHLCAQACGGLNSLPPANRTITLCVCCC